MNLAPSLSPLLCVVAYGTVLQFKYNPILVVFNICEILICTQNIDISMIRLTRISRSKSSNNFSRILNPRTYQIANMSDKSSLDKQHGSVGSAFKADGPVGGTAQKVGGPLDKDGVVGKQFTEGGALGGTAQSAAETAQGEKPSALDAQGMIGKQFTTAGAIGGTAQKVGGPFDQDGVIGKQFKPDGAVGGTVQQNFGDKK
ncbi:hypothetical protein GJ744_006480 [Endocarpon pusillum]|uniref:Uncharacterized protein n=1 Tax=Endocarpon pusillum TaxID=364733 RepID=A0A8H7EBK4_9EURO|nr:hypothetical protein GJ744_006480 [Endocarpon pusillum]